MPNYRRARAPGGTFFLTLVTYRRLPLFIQPENLQRLRVSLSTTRSERPFEVVAAVVMPDHLHCIWRLPDGDEDLSARVGRFKLLFTRSVQAEKGIDPSLSPSREKHREGDIWQRRFWEHLIRDERDLEQHLDYIHYNPVKHGLAACPHAWPVSSFARWVERGGYQPDWCCSCEGRAVNSPAPDIRAAGEVG